MAFRGDDLFVGREEELSALRASAQEVRTGRLRVVLVQGAPGVGKSALIRRWLAAESRTGRRDGATLLRAFCDASEGDMSFGMLAQLLSGVEPERLALYPILRDGLPPAGASPLQAGGQVLGLLGDLQADGPVAVVVEDMHWADQESRHALGFALRRLEADRVLAVLTGRPPLPEDFRAAVAARKEGLVLDLQGLGDDAVAELAHKMTGEQPQAAAVSRLRRHTGGNPLYLRTVLAELPSGALLSPRKQTWPVPESLAISVRRQLDRLTAEARAMTEAAAVLGTRSPLSQVARLAGVDEPHAALRAALDAGLLRWWPDSPSSPVAVAHALQADAIVKGLAPVRRRDLHTGAAALVDQSAAWRHRVAAADGLDDRLAAELEQAASERVAAGAAERAATLLLWASELSSRRAERERLLLTAAGRLLFATRVARVQELLPRIQACTDTPLRTAVLGGVAMVSGALDQAEKQLREAFEAAQRLPDERWTAAFAGTGLGIMYFFGGSHGEEILRVTRRVLDLRVNDPFLDYLARANLLYGHMYVGGAWAGLEALERAAPLPTAEEVDHADAYLLGHRGIMRVTCGMPTAAREDLSQVLRMVERGVSHVLEEYVRVFLAQACYWTGAWDDAALHGRLAVDTATTDRRFYAYADAHAFAAWVPAARGETRYADELLRTAEKHALPYSQGNVAMGWAVEAQARADWPGVLTAVNGILALPRDRVRPNRALWRPLQAEALIRTGRVAEAEPVVAEVAALAEAFPALAPTVSWLSGLLAAARQDTAAARAHYEQGLSLPPSPDHFALHGAFLAHDYGRLLVGLRKPQEGAAWLKRARDRYRSLQAAAFLTRCEEDLAVVAGGPGARSGSPAELTGREDEIARLVARGYTNREIATRLFISSKTVEYHLGNIYGKLGLSNRRQLRDHVQRRAVEPT
ncbi:helix-turn-helix transcriptional regulator [Streptomyces sp. TRM64462]|uniref:helix-turn-helix transcriptional regulator n=1 Tax=Streptomyces sp. TRM64462 TaxID=2741726 RepID=UPI001586537E|nr:LuxR family transcriptional regulator [Streptomyces sp. TRM64462]